MCSVSSAPINQPILTTSLSQPTLLTSPIPDEIQKKLEEERRDIERREYLLSQFIVAYKNGEITLERLGHCARLITIGFSERRRLINMGQVFEEALNSTPPKRGKGFTTGFFPRTIRQGISELVDIIMAEEGLCKYSAFKRAEEIMKNYRIPVTFRQIEGWHSEYKKSITE